jgi:hypothetical protein
MTYDDNEENMLMMKIIDENDDEYMIMNSDEELTKSRIMVMIYDGFE